MTVTANFEDLEAPLFPPTCQKRPERQATDPCREVGQMRQPRVEGRVPVPQHGGRPLGPVRQHDVRR
jgi:hypothetical protein